MGLPTDFWEQLPLKTDAEVYDIVAHRDDYLPEAITAAREELKKRNLAPEQVAQLEAKVQSEAGDAEAKAKERLSWPLRIVIFILCSGIFGILLALYYENTGYKAKATDCWVTLAFSIAFHALAGVVLYSTH